jgi:cyclopropane fatty-acyl-phospholipid synthase-like methyltransferase
MKIKITQDGIKTIARRRLKDRIEDCPSLLNSLTQKNFLRIDNGIYRLTDSGRLLGKRMQTKWLSDFYGDILVRSAESKAHALFCEKVFGKNLCQYNVMDMEQLEGMLQALNLSQDDYVLDLGCGNGKITEYISNQTGAKILGIDLAEAVIQWAQKNTESKNNKIGFKVMNMNDLQFPSATFDVIIAIDTLYPWNIENLEVTISKLKDFLKPTGQMGIFYAQYRDPKENLELLEDNKTEMAKALIKNELTFKTIDYTENGRNIWFRELSTAQELREMFEKEGNLDLCEQRIQDSKNTLDKIDNEQERRYFYHVKD